MANQPTNQQPNPNRNKKPRGPRVMYIVYGVIMLPLLWSLVGGKNGSSGKREITWERLEPILEKEHYESITVINQEVAEVRIKNDVARRDTITYRDIIGRTNRYTGKKYTEDPAIMSWQIGNEPRAFSEEAKQPFAKWLAEASALIRSLDKNHLISIGSEGSWGCENDMSLYEQICSDKNIDYMNIHLWPYNWGWAHERTLKKDLQKSCDNTKAYIDEHLVLAGKLNKPVVMEEFGFPRDGFSFSQESTTNVRDAYYRFVFGLVAENALSGGHFAGCNFWGWGGDANPQHQQWQVGDDYTGDPAQEAQGLNSVFSTDLSTIEVIREQVARIGSAGK